MIVPSILNADSLNLKAEIKKVVNQGITRCHLDIMDGHFVPNLSFGPQLVADFKREFPLIQAEIHLMSNNVGQLLPLFVESGADIVLLHYEAMSELDLKKNLTYLAQNGVKAGLVLNPETDVMVIEKYLDQIQQVLLMTVHPGFGKQKFLPESIARIKQARELLANYPKIRLEVDGGINQKTIKSVQAAGADTFVVGSYIFNNGSISHAVKSLEQILS